MPYNHDDLYARVPAVASRARRMGCRAPHLCTHLQLEVPNGVRQASTFWSFCQPHPRQTWDEIWIDLQHKLGVQQHRCLPVWVGDPAPNFYSEPSGCLLCELVSALKAWHVRIHCSVRYFWMAAGGEPLWLNYFLCVVFDRVHSHCRL